jgi:hypothetical protein
VALFAKLKDDVREVCFLDPREEVGGRLPRSGIHAHVERFVTAKAEAATLRIQLHR